MAEQIQTWLPEAEAGEVIRASTAEAPRILALALSMPEEIA
jgi:hypothetical protein